MITHSPVIQQEPAAHGEEFDTFRAACACGWVDAYQSTVVQHVTRRWDEHIRNP